jgi:hypothetical protein
MSHLGLLPDWELEWPRQTMVMGGEGTLLMGEVDALFMRGSGERECARVSRCPQENKLFDIRHYFLGLNSTDQ